MEGKDGKGIMSQQLQVLLLLMVPILGFVITALSFCLTQWRMAKRRRQELSRQAQEAQSDNGDISSRKSFSLAITVNNDI